MRTTKIFAGMWGVPNLGKRCEYRIYTKRKGHTWKIYRRNRTATVTNALPLWHLVESGFTSKASAVEYAIEQAGRDDDKDPVADLLNNIDDGVNLNEEGWDK
jgi:hypothetical protein